MPLARGRCLARSDLGGLFKPLGHIVALDVSYRRPVLHGDKLRSLALVTDAETSPRVHLDLSLENERGERPLQGTAVVELPTRSG